MLKPVRLIQMLKVLKAAGAAAQAHCRPADRRTIQCGWLKGRCDPNVGLLCVCLRAWSVVKLRAAGRVAASVAVLVERGQFGAADTWRE